MFCHFRETGRSLRAHLSAALNRHIDEVAGTKLGCGPKEVTKQLESVGRQFDRRRPLSRQLKEVVQGILGSYPELPEPDREKVEEIVTRFVRTPSFLVRYFPLGKTRKTGLLTDAFAQPGRYGVELPIATQMAEVLAGRTDVRTALDALMLRRQRSETESV